MSALVVEVCKVDAVEPHPTKERLDIITIKGWSCLVGKSQHKVGDLVVFVPPDSVCPPALIDKYNLTYLKNGGRVGVIRIGGIVSQGLVLPAPNNARIGQDLAVSWGITKYEQPEPPAQLQPRFVGPRHIWRQYRTGVWSGLRARKELSRWALRVLTRRKGNHPDFPEYTDICNIKHYPTVFRPGDDVVITEKIHGTNVRYGNLKSYKKFWEFWKPEYLFVYGSHHRMISAAKAWKGFYSDDVYGKIADRLDLANKIPEDCVIYGEIYGKGVQDLTYNEKDIAFRVFDIHQNGKYLSWCQVRAICNRLGLETVPVLYCGPLTDTETVAKYTSGPSVLYPKQIREGCVVKSELEEVHPRIGRKILKSVSVEYLTRPNGTEWK